ncbi:MAG: MazG-like family protein [Bacilli bacterium]
MNVNNKDSHITKHIRAIEWLKTEILDQIAGLFKAILRGSEQRIIDCIASLLIAVHLLASRLGIKYHELDEAMLTRIRNRKDEGHELEDWFGDLTKLEEYIKKR